MGTLVRERPPKSLVAVLLLGVILRVVYVLLFVDLGHIQYWEYGEIVNNLLAGKGYSLFHFDGLRNTILFDPGASPDPSAWMAPGYVAFLVPFFYIPIITLRNALVLFVQIVFGGILILTTYRFTRDHFSAKAAMYAAAITAILPEFIYATASVTPTLLYQLGIVAVLGLLYPATPVDLRKAILIALISAGLVAIRPEFLLFVGLTMVLLIYRRQVRAAMVIVAVVVLFLLPWQLRNYSVFGEWVPLTTSGGLNLFRGHNEVQIGAWSDDYIEQHVPSIAHGPRFELELNALYEARALDFARSHPLLEIENSGLKVVRFWFFDPSDGRTTRLLYIVPWGLMLLLALVGIFRSRGWTFHRVSLLFLGYSTLIVIVFFVLPRYQTMMKIALVPFAAVGLEWMLNSQFIRSIRWRRPFFRTTP